MLSETKLGFLAETPKSLNTPIYIGSFRAPFALVLADPGSCPFRAPLPCFGPVLDSLMRNTPGEDRKTPSTLLQALGLNATTGSTREQDRTGQDRTPPATTGNHFQRLQPEITRSPQRQPEGNLESF